MEVGLGSMLGPFPQVLIQHLVYQKEIDKVWMYTHFSYSHVGSISSINLLIDPKFTNTCYESFYSIISIFLKHSQYC